MSDPVPPLGAGGPTAFAVNVAQSTLTPLRPAPPAALDGGSARASQPGSAAIARAETTAVEFEAAMLTSFIEPMLPSEDSPVWGGTGASAWRGLFAQEVAAEIARAGGIGLADIVRPALQTHANSEPTSQLNRGDTP